LNNNEALKFDVSRNNNFSETAKVKKVKRDTSHNPNRSFNTVKDNLKSNFYKTYNNDSIAESSIKGSNFGRMTDTVIDGTCFFVGENIFTFKEDVLKALAAVKVGINVYQLKTGINLKCDDKKGMKFELEIKKSEELETIFFVNFMRVYGNPSIYREMCQKIVRKLMNC